MSSETIDRYQSEESFRAGLSKDIPEERVKSYARDPYWRSSSKVYVHEDLDAGAVQAIKKEGYHIVSLPKDMHEARYGCGACGNRQHFSVDLMMEYDAKMVDGNLILTDSLDVISDIIESAGRFKAVEVLALLRNLGGQGGGLPSDPNRKVSYKFRIKDEVKTMLMSLADIYDGVREDSIPLNSPGGMDVKCSSCGSSVWDAEWGEDNHAYVNGKKEAVDDHENCGGCFVCSSKQPLMDEAQARCEYCMATRYACQTMDWDPEWDYSKAEIQEMRANGEEPMPENFESFMEMMSNTGYCYDSQCGNIRHVEFWGIDHSNPDFLANAKRQAYEELHGLEEAEKKFNEKQKNNQTVEEVANG